MKRNMVILVCLLIVSVFSLAGCSSKGECDECGQYEELKEYKSRYGDKTYNLCEDCYELAKFVGS